MAKKQSQKKRTGTLYRRWKGKDYSIDDPIAKDKGSIWLKYDLHGKTTRKSLKTSDLQEAEAERDRIMLPLQLADEIESSAQLELRTKQAQQKLNAVMQSQNPPTTIEDAWETYLGSHERPDSGERTLKDYATHWRKFCSWLSDAQPDILQLKDITNIVASQYASHLMKENLSANTFNKRINFLKLLCKTLAEPARMESNPFDKIKSKKLKTESKRELTQHELKTILESANGDLKLLLYIGTFTGLRLGDCATLKWGEVDMDKLLIRRIPNKTQSRNPKPVMIGIDGPLYALLNQTPLKKRKGSVLPHYAADYATDPSKLSNVVQRHYEKCDIQTHKDGTGIIKIPDPDNPKKLKKIDTGKRAVVSVLGPRV